MNVTTTFHSSSSSSCWTKVNRQTLPTPWSHAAAWLNIKAMDFYLTGHIIVYKPFQFYCWNLPLRLSFSPLYTRHVVHLCSNCLHVIRLGLGLILCWAVRSGETVTVNVQKYILVSQGVYLSLSLAVCCDCPPLQNISYEYQQHWTVLPWGAACSSHLCLVPQDQSAA